jgi:ABC-type uncharacterized transport system permease subunit
VNDLVFIIGITLKSSIAVLLASIGEVFAERSGILNLGVEGMMLIGAMVGFAVGLETNSIGLAFAAAMLAGGGLALIHALLSIHLQADQVISGLAITLFGAGISSFFGRAYIGRVGLRIPSLDVTLSGEFQWMADLLGHLSLPALAALLAVPFCRYLLRSSALGLSIRAVGEAPEAADAAGVPVARIRYGCTVLGGCTAGLAGAYLSLVYTPGWKENMVAGQGWIAIAVVIFSAWDPLRAMFGALLFGGLNALQFYFQATGNAMVPAYLLRMLPYLLTIVVLTLVTAAQKGRISGAPAALGRPFQRET